MERGEEDLALHSLWVEIVGNEGAGRKLVQCLQRHNPVLHSFGGEDINQILRCIFAAVLKQMGVDPAKLEDLVVAEEQLPSEVECVWQVRVWW